MLLLTPYHFDIHLHMAYPNIAFPQERDHVIMEIFSADLSPNSIQSLGRCRVALEAILLSDLTTVDGKYLKDFVFAPGGRDKASTFKFPCERPTWSDWSSWFNFWHNFTITGDTLKVGSDQHIAYGNGTTEQTLTTCNGSKATLFFTTIHLLDSVSHEQQGSTI
jgi:hypothetical protein